MITTKYIGPTNFRGSRVKATSASASITLPWDPALNPSDNHDRAARALAEKLDLHGEWYRAAVDGGGYAYMRPLWHAFSRPQFGG